MHLLGIRPRNQRKRNQQLPLLTATWKRATKRNPKPSCQFLNQTEIDLQVEKKDDDDDVMPVDVDVDDRPRPKPKPKKNDSDGAQVEPPRRRWFCYRMLVSLVSTTVVVLKGGASTTSLAK
jgi:hypothetical protein